MSRDCKTIIERLERSLDESGKFDTDDVDVLVRSAGVVLEMGGSAVLTRKGPSLVLTLTVDAENC